MKAKELTSCSFPAQLICAFVSAYVKSSVSNDAAHFSLGHSMLKLPCYLDSLKCHFCKVKLGFTRKYIIFLMYALIHRLGRGLGLWAEVGYLLEPVLSGNKN